MSYILDALKKAERERDIRKVPTLMVEHDSRKTQTRRLWFILGLVATGVASAVLLTVLFQKIAGPPAATPPASVSAPAAPAPRAAQSGASLPGPVASARRPAGQESRSRPAGSAPALPAVTQPDPSRYAGAERLDPERIREIAQWMAEASRRDEGDEEIPPPVEPSRRQRRLVPGEISEPVARPETPAAPPQPVTLKEAAADMVLSILVYDDNPADRMVFIDGRKYVEGDYIDDKYFLESIALEGATLTYHAERVLLRPRAR